MTFTQNSSIKNSDIKKINNAHLIVAIAIALITAVVYLPALNNDFVDWDDDLYVFENPYIRSMDWKLFRWAFFGFHQSGNWHPLTSLSHAIDYAFWGLNPFGHHLSNIILHAVNTFVVVLLVVKLMEAANLPSLNAPSAPPLNLRGGRGELGFPINALIVAAITGILFGIHPLHVESVAWVSERKDVLYAFFFLLSILSYIRYVKAGKEGSVFAAFFDRHYLTCLFFFFLSLMSKPMAVTLPVILLIMDWYPFGRLEKAGTLRIALLEKIPLFLLSLISSVLTLFAQRSGEAITPLAMVPLSTRILVGFRALAAYLGEMAWPTKLTPFYSYPQKVSVLSVEFFLPAILVMGITTACVVFSGRHRDWSAIWLSYVVMLLPVLGIIQVGEQSMADRYTYLPSIGPFLFAGLGAAWGVETISSSRKRNELIKIVSIFGTVLVTVFMIVTTVRQIHIWKNGITLFSRAIEIEPRRSQTPYNNRGVTYVRLRQFEKALEDFTQAIHLSPNASGSYYNRGIAYRNLGLLEEAIQDFTRAINLSRSPDFHNYYDRGIAYLMQERYEEALNDFTKAISLNPNDPDAYTNRGNVYTYMGRHAEALGDYTKAISLNPDSSILYYNRGIVQMNLGRFAESLEDFTQAINLSPSPHPNYYINRGVLYERLGRHQDAARDFTMARGIKTSTPVMK